MKRERVGKKRFIRPEFSSKSETLNAYLFFLDPNAKPPIILLSPSLLGFNTNLSTFKRRRHKQKKEAQSERERESTKDMKIQCDVCDKVEASVFCPADEAALCHNCDRTIHHANKLAGKHPRFSLHHPTSKDFPFCDICQERRAYLFCQEDRAILCRECDLPVHRANEHTQNHNRFLLTGVKLSGTSLDPAASSPINGTDRVSGLEIRSSRPKLHRHGSVSNENASSSCKVEDNVASDTGSVSTSSISEYLTETIPGYCFEDLLDASFAPNNPNGFCKDQDLEVPKAQVQSPQLITSSLPWIGSAVGVKEMPKADTVKGNWKWRHHDCKVYGISPPFIKKSRRSR